jgi:hypothetical protein
MKQVLVCLIIAFVSCGYQEVSRHENQLRLSIDKLRCDIDDIFLRADSYSYLFSRVQHHHGQMYVGNEHYYVQEMDTVYLLLGIHIPETLHITLHQGADRGMHQEDVLQIVKVCEVRWGYKRPGTRAAFSNLSPVYTIVTHNGMKLQQIFIMHWLTYIHI